MARTRVVELVDQQVAGHGVGVVERAVERSRPRAQAGPRRPQPLLGRGGHVVDPVVVAVVAQERGEQGAGLEPGLPVLVGEGAQGGGGVGASETSGAVTGPLCTNGQSPVNEVPYRRRRGPTDHRRRRVHRCPLRRQPGGCVRARGRHHRGVDAGRGRRAQPVGDRVRGAARRRRPRPPVVHAGDRDRPVRPCHARLRPRARRRGPVPHAQRGADLRAWRRRCAHPRLPGGAGRADRRRPRLGAGARAARRPRGRDLGQRHVGPRRAGLARGRAGDRARPGPDPRPGRARRRGGDPGRPARGRLGGSRLRPEAGHRRRPRHGGRPLRDRPVVGGPHRPVGAHGRAGLAPRRHRRDARRGRQGGAVRPGGHGDRGEPPRRPTPG